MEKLKSILFVSCLAMSQYAFADEENTSFDPYFSFEVGLSGVDLNDLEVSGIPLSSPEIGLGFGPALGYQLTKDWGFLVRYGNHSPRFATKRNRNTPGEPLLEVEQQTNLLTISGIYRVSIASWLDFNFDAGTIIVDDTEKTRECIELSPTLSCDTWSPYEVNRQTKVSAIAGTSLVFKFSENWGLKLGYQYSPYRNGLTKTDLMIRYDF